MNKEKGFTLIELIVVIIILAIISVIILPRLVNLQDSAWAANVSGTGSAFKSSINLARVKWIAAGGTGSMDNLQVYGSTSAGQLDINIFGWPAQNWPPFESNPQLNNVADCISVWNTVLVSGSASVSNGSTSDYDADYIAPNACIYRLNANSNLSISYNSNTGVVDIDSTP